MHQPRLAFGGELRFGEELVRLGEHRLERHAAHTHSALAERILADWDASLPKFVRVIAKDYERVLESMKEVEASGLSGEEAIMAAFELNKNDRVRVSGN